MPVLLDTDHLSVLQWEEQPACSRLLKRLDRLPADDIATSIISFHEQVQGLAGLSESQPQAGASCRCLREARSDMALVLEDERRLVHRRSASLLLSDQTRLPACQDAGSAHSEHCDQHRIRVANSECARLSSGPGCAIRGLDGVSHRLRRIYVVPIVFLQLRSVLQGHRRSQSTMRCRM